MKNLDVVVVGSGIAGMTAAIYLKRQNKNVIIIEKEVPGGQLIKIPNIENYPGFSSISGYDLAINIYNQINNLDIPIIYENVTNVTEGKVVTSMNTYNCKHIIIATGRIPSKLHLDKEDDLIGRGISYCATCDGAFYKNKNVAVVGSGSSSITEALYLSNICDKVYVICRKDKLKAEQILINEILEKQNVNIIYNCEINKLNIEENKLSSISLNNKEILKISGLFICIGYEPNFYQNKEMKKTNGYINVDGNMKTNISNIYAIGDIIKKDVYQLTTAVAEATICAEYINKH